MITVGKQYFYKIQNVQTLAGTGTGSQATNEVIDSVFAGILLDITPEISSDGTITLKINPSVSDTIQPIGEDNTQRTMPPDLERRQMASVVTVKDGSHVILGGLITEKEQTSVNKVPVLGDIPYLGYAFKYDEKTSEKIELVIIVTPHLVKATNQMTLKDLGYDKLSDSNLTKMP
jgi:general secretion pathway protein D